MEDVERYRRLFAGLRYGQLGIVVAKAEKGQELAEAARTRRFRSWINGGELPEEYRRFSSLGLEVVEIEADPEEYPELMRAVVLRRPLVGDPAPEAFAVATPAAFEEWERESVDEAIDRLRSIMEEVYVPNPKPVEWIVSEWRQRSISYSISSSSAIPSLEDLPPCPPELLELLSEERPLTAAEEEEVKEDAELSELAEDKKALMDKLTAIVLEYVTRFKEMPPMEAVNQLLRGRITTQGEGLSGVRVSGEMRVFLPDFNELELRLPALLRAIYILFLRHPTGIRLKDMADHAGELGEIYSMVMPGREDKKAREVIANLVQPYSDSLRQKLSKINSALRDQILSPALAERYTVKGQRGQPYGIDVPQELRSFPQWMK